MNEEVDRFVTKMATWASLFCRLPSLFSMTRQFSFCMFSHERPAATSFRPRPTDPNTRSTVALQAWVGIRKEKWIFRKLHRCLNGMPLADVVGPPCLDLQVVERYRQAVECREEG